MVSFILNKEGKGRNFVLERLFWGRNRNTLKIYIACWKLRPDREPRDCKRIYIYNGRRLKSSHTPGVHPIFYCRIPFTPLNSRGQMYRMYAVYTFHTILYDSIRSPIGLLLTCNCPPEVDSESLSLSPDPGCHYTWFTPHGIVPSVIRVWTGFL